MAGKKVKNAEKTELAVDAADKLVAVSHGEAEITEPNPNAPIIHNLFASMLVAEKTDIGVHIDKLADALSTGKRE